MVKNDVDSKNVADVAALMGYSLYMYIALYIIYYILFIKIYLYKTYIEKKPVTLATSATYNNNALESLTFFVPGFLYAVLS